MFCIRSPELTHLITRSLYSDQRLPISPTSQPLATTIPLCFHEFGFLRFCTKKREHTASLCLTYFTLLFLLMRMLPPPTLSPPPLPHSRLQQLLLMYRFPLHTNSSEELSGTPLSQVAPETISPSHLLPFKKYLLQFIIISPVYFFTCPKF